MSQNKKVIFDVDYGIGKNEKFETIIRLDQLAHIQVDHEIVHPILIDFYYCIVNSITTKFTPKRIQTEYQIIQCEVDCITYDISARKNGGKE